MPYYADVYYAKFMAQQTVSTDFQWNTVTIIHGRVNRSFLSLRIWILFCFSLNLSVLSRAQRWCLMKERVHPCHGVLLQTLRVMCFLQFYSSLKGDPYLPCLKYCRVRPKPRGHLQQNSSKDWISGFSSTLIAMFKEMQAFWLFL